MLVGPLVSLLAASAPTPAVPAGPELPAPIAVELRWTGPATCSDAEPLRRAFERFTGRPLSTMSRAPTRVEVVIVAEGDALVMELSARTGAAMDRRSLRAARCDDLAGAAALIVAVALQPVEVARRTQPPRREEALTAPTAPLDPRLVTDTESARAPLPLRDSVSPAPDAANTTPRPARSTSRSPSPNSSASRHGRSASRPRASSLRGTLAASIGGAFGLTPGIGAGLLGAAALRGRRWSVGVLGHHWFPRDTPVVQDTAIRVDLTAGGLQGCWIPQAGPLELPLCAGGELGSMSGQGRGPRVESRRARALWAGAHAGIGLAFAPHPVVALRTSVEGIATLRQPAFDLERGGQRTERFRASPAGVRGALGIELRFP